MNAIEISKREAKILLLRKQLEDFRGKENGQNENNEEALNKHIEQHNNQIEILGESTKQNLIKRQSMKEQLFENYNKITTIRSSIHDRIESNDLKEHLLLVIKCQFLESQNIQLLLNLQLQAKTISKYDKWYNNILQSGGIPENTYEMLAGEEDLLEDEEEEEAYSDNYEEEEKVESSTENPPPTSKPSNPSIGGVSNANKSNVGSKIPRVGKGSSVRKFNIMNNPYAKKNPYLAQQSKKKK